jgi:hypothetical protein
MANFRSNMQKCSLYRANAEDETKWLQKFWGLIPYFAFQGLRVILEKIWGISKLLNGTNVKSGFRQSLGHKTDNSKYL